MKPQYKDHLTPFTFKQSRIRDNLQTADDGTILEHLCPYGLSQSLAPSTIKLLNAKCVKEVDRVINKMMFGKAAN